MPPRDPALTPNDPQLLQAMQQVSLLQGLPVELIAEIAKASRFKRYRARQEVMARDDVDRDCYFVLRGRLRVTAWSRAGREVSFREVGAGETFGELAAIDGRPRSASVIALSEAWLARLSPETLTDLMQRHWPIADRMLQSLAASARSLTDRIYELSTLSVQQRLCAELLRLCAPPGSERPAQAVLDPLPSHSELAGRIGTVRVQVLRELAELERLGLVARAGRSLHVPDVHGLAQHLARDDDSD